MLASAALFVPIEAHCQDADTANTDSVVMELVRAGIVQYRDNHPELALAAFQKAWEIKKTPTIAANLGRVELKLGMFRSAAEHWTYYLDQHPSDPTEAKDALAECRRHVGSIRVTVNEPTAHVWVDGNEVGVAQPGSDIWVDPGSHIAYAELDGRRSPKRTVDVSAGGTSAVSLHVSQPESTKAPVASAAPHASPSTPPSHADAQYDSGGGVKPKTVVLIGGSVLTVAAATTAIVYTLKGNAAYDDAKRISSDIGQQAVDAGLRPDGACVNPTAQFSSMCGELRGKIDENDRDRNLAIGSYVAAGVFGAATVATYFLWPEPKSERADLAVIPIVAPGTRGVQLLLRF